MLAILEANPGFKYALVTDSDADPGVVVVQIGIRDVGFGGIVIAKARFDGMALLNALGAYVGETGSVPPTRAIVPNNAAIH